jgi:sporulation protein YlmC with PRC-barrel domain
MLARLRDYGDADLGRELRNTDVYDVAGKKLGTVDDFLVDPDTSDLRYLVVDAGWLTSRRFIIPADEVFAGTDNELAVNLTKDDVKRLPEFREELLDSPDQFQRYERTYQEVGVYGRDRRNSLRSSHLANFRDELKSRGLRRQGFRRAERIETEPVSPAKVVEARREPISSTSVISHPTAVYGLYSDRADLERAVSELKDLGFSNNDISVVFPDKEKSRDFALEHNTKAPEGALAGGGTGLVIGGVLGWLAGIGAIMIPGVGPIIAAGPIVAAIAGAGVGSAIGGIAGALIGLGVPELEAKRYETEVKKGGLLLSVQCGDVRFAESARKVLQKTGAKDLYVTGERRVA